MFLPPLIHLYFAPSARFAELRASLAFKLLAWKVKMNPVDTVFFEEEYWIFPRCHWGCGDSKGTERSAAGTSENRRTGQLSDGTGIL